ncbi:MAG: hypothetical protein ACI4RA_01280 [Kiritimatiellia bacterium]
MSRHLVPLLAAALLIASGCTTVRMTRAYNGVRVEGGATPATTLEIENSGWFLLTFIPFASGDVERPNQTSCRWFRNTVKVENNVKVLKDIMQRERVREVANLTSHRSDEKYLFFLLERRACHTSAVLLQPEAPSTSGKSSK